MTIRLASHLHKNRYGVYGFRVVIPRDLRLCLSRKEIRVSLRTSNKAHAKKLAARYSVVTNNYFDQIRQAPSFDDALASGHELLQALTGGGGTFDSLTEQLDGLLTQVGNAESDLLRRLLTLRREYSSVTASKQAHLNELAERLAGKSESTPDAEIDSVVCDFYAEAAPLIARENAIRSELNELSLSAQKSLLGSLHQRDIETLQQTQKTEISSITDLAAEIAAKATARAAKIILGAEKDIPNTQTVSEPLSAIVDAYCANQISEGSWTAKTEAENRAIFALWVRIVGDQPIQGYGFEQHRDYKAKLQQLPSNLNKSPRYRGKSIDEVLALGDSPAAPNTINKNLTRVSALFEWAIKYGYATLNPARGMTIANPKRANEERQAFSDDDLTKLFGSVEYVEGRHKLPYQYWVPLIALYTGARLNEMCQLYLSDLDESDGIKILRITADGGSKRLKTKAARRYIPLHPELIRLGLLDYADRLHQQGHDRLFPELKEGRDGYGHAASKWFAAYATRCGVDAPGKVFHSFRHTFIDQLKQAEVPKEKIAALVGHEDESVTFGRYGKDFKVETLATILHTIPSDPTQHLLGSISIYRESKG